MIDIFLSRPTDISEFQELGLNNLLSFLKKENLNPRTLGTTDYAQESPLNEIIQILELCSGMIVLGYSKIFIEQGVIKGERVKEPVKMASEWNQIEAALAYCTRKPLLIICDKGVSFGFFDKGTANCYVHQVDFSDPQWSLQRSIQGAILKWKERVVVCNRKKDDVNNTTKVPTQHDVDLFKKFNNEMPHNQFIYFLEQHDIIDYHNDDNLTIAFDFIRNWTGPDNDFSDSQASQLLDDFKKKLKKVCVFYATNTFSRGEHLSRVAEWVLETPGEDDKMREKYNPIADDAINAYKELIKYGNNHLVQ